MSATAENTAAKPLANGSSISLLMLKKKKIISKNIFIFDFPAELQVYDVIDSAHKEIFDRITQDIFNDTLPNGNKDAKSLFH